MYFGNNIDNEDFGAIWYPDKIFFSLTKILVCVLCIYSIAIIKLAISKCYDAILKLCMWKRAKYWDAKDLGGFFFFSFDVLQ